MHIACWITKVKHTLTLWNAYYSSTVYTRNRILGLIVWIILNFIFVKHCITSRNILPPAWRFKGDSGDVIVLWWWKLPEHCTLHLLFVSNKGIKYDVTSTWLWNIPEHLHTLLILCSKPGWGQAWRPSCQSASDELKWPLTPDVRHFGSTASTIFSLCIKTQNAY